MANATIQIRVEDGISPQLQQFAALMGGGTILEAFADEFMRCTWDTFGESGEGRPNEWPGLSPRYQKQIGYFGPPTLILTGELIGSIRVMEQGADSITVGTDVPYAAVHQYGDALVPRRSFFPVIEDGGEAMLTPAAEARCNARIERELALVVPF